MNSNYANSQNLYCGKDATGSRYRIFIRPTDVSTIPSTATLITAQIRLNCNLAGSGVYNIYQVTGSWLENVTWSNAPSYSTLIDIVTINGVVGTWYTFDILDVAKLWLIGSSNYGIIIKTAESDVDNISFYSSNSATAGNRPIYYFQYNNDKKRKSILLKSSQGGGILL
jgi:hypothetical protein